MPSWTTRVSRISPHGSRRKKTSPDTKPIQCDPFPCHRPHTAGSRNASSARKSRLWDGAQSGRMLWRCLNRLPPTVSPLLKPFLPLALRFAQSELGEKLLAKLNTGDETKPPFIIQNEYFIVEASPSDGTLTVTDKRTNTIFKDSTVLWMAATRATNTTTRPRTAILSLPQSWSR